ncbi:MAG: isoaspartyl peptidase/L-asparaginase [Pseudomonadota bacterium]
MADIDSIPMVVVHGGAGASKQDEDGCQAAARAGLALLGEGQDALAAAVAAVVALEDDGRFNAGSGAVLCLDGCTVELDAAVMDTRGALGAVACLQRVKNPVLVARAVAGSPHWLLAGEGAERFARTAGFAPHLAIGERARARHGLLMRRLQEAEAVLPGVDNAAFARHWNYPLLAAAPAGEAACDTVGAVARDAQGHFAVACSTGGSAPSLLGRVGDTPIIGSGFYAGPHGAVAVTGLGEHIVRHLLAFTVYQWIAQGLPLEQALRRGVDLFEPRIDVGLIAIGRGQAGSLSNRAMPVGQAGHG